MKQYSFSDDTGREFIHVDRRAARKAYDAGYTVACVGCELRPGRPWFPEYYADRDRFPEFSFDGIAEKLEHFGTGPGMGARLAWYVQAAATRYDWEQHRYVLNL